LARVLSIRLARAKIKAKTVQKNSAIENIVSENDLN
jgi:hypothetical protein